MNKRNNTKPDNSDPRDFVRAAVSSALGAVTGYSVITATGMTAVGMVGSGAGIGAPAGPVGIAVGAIGGLAIYGVYRAFKR